MTDAARRAAGERERLQREAERLLEAVNELDKSGWAQTADYLALFHEALREAERRVRDRVCEWAVVDTYDDQHYETGCNEAYCLIDGTLEQNRHLYCPYCGGKIQLAAAPGREGKEEGNGN